jgi:hypothetical protein
LDFHEVEDRAYNGMFVAPAHVRRLSEVWHRYLGYPGNPSTREVLGAKVQSYLREMEKVGGAFGADELP